jgi:SNF2 family DNA or RNA helicase
LTAASTVAFTEMWWRPADHAQAEKRVHRIGTTERVWSHWLIAHGTIEEKLCRIVQDKQAGISEILDGERTKSDIAVFSQLMNQVRCGGLF